MRHRVQIHASASAAAARAARWYDPTTGNWTQQETLNAPLDPANGDRYAYAADDPINNADPPPGQGLLADVVGLGLGLIGVGALLLGSGVVALAIGAVVTVAAFAQGVDAVACDLGSDLACNVFN